MLAWVLNLDFAASESTPPSLTTAVGQWAFDAEIADWAFDAEIADWAVNEP